MPHLRGEPLVVSGGGDGSFALRTAEDRCVLSSGRNSAVLVFCGVNLGLKW